MLPLIAIAVGGAAVGSLLLKGLESPLPGRAWARKGWAFISRIGNGVEQAPDSVLRAVKGANDKYQSFVQHHVDPLLGETRHNQMRAISDKLPELTEEEQIANQRLALGAASLVTASAATVAIPAVMPLAIVFGLGGMWRTYAAAYKELIRGKFSTIHLICIYLGVLWLGGYALVGALGAFLMAFGLKIRAISENRSHENLIHIFQLQPERVWIRVRGLEVEVPFDQLSDGDTLVLRAGQTVPVDGTVVAGAALLDQRALTGESQPSEKTVGDQLLASTLVVSGAIDVSVQKTGRETTAGQIVNILNDASHTKTRMSLQVIQKIDRLALPALGLSAASVPFIGLAGGVSLLGSNYMVNSYLTSPLAMLNFLNLAAARGVLVKDGTVLEKLNQVRVFVFDKTGTLTHEQPEVGQIYSFEGLDENELLWMAATAEARQTHPIARALLSAAAERGISPASIDEAHYEIGYGIRVRLVGQGGAVVRVGSARFMAMEEIEVPVRVQELSRISQSQGRSLLMVSVNDRLTGGIELCPAVRPETKRIIQGLRDRGLDVYIVSGDQELPTRKLASELGMTGYFANVLPEQKANIVAELQRNKGPACFVGDGINDTIAMRQADVSISLRGATSVATDTAGAILMNGNLEGLLPLLDLSQHFQNNLKRNIGFTAGTSIVAASGILFAGFTFLATEVLYFVSLIGGIGIAMSPAWSHFVTGQGRSVSSIKALPASEHVAAAGGQSS